jgi:hypothetical protein
MAFNPDAYLKSLEQAPVDTFDPDAYLKSLEPPKAEESSFIRRALGDTAVGLGQGVVSAGQAAVGIADIPTFGAAGKALSAIGYDPQRTNQILQELKSPEEQEIEKKIAETKGFLPTAKEIITHPTALLDFGLQSAPSMVGGAGIARKILTTADKMLAKKLGLSLEEYATKKAAETAASTVAAEAATQRAILAGAAGEGAVSAGSTAEQIREQNPSGYLTPAQVAISTVSGALTGTLGVFGGKLANKLGIGDIDTILAGGAGTAAQTAVKKSIFLKAAEGALSESVFEELPQSMQEQISQNLATGKPWDQGVAEAGAQGAMAAIGMGGIGGGVSQYSANKQIEKNAQAQPTIETPAVPLIEAQAGTVSPVVTPAGVPPVVNPVLTDADVEDLQEEPITSSTFVPKTGDKVNVTWKNTDDYDQQTATGEVVTWKDGSQYVKVETGQLENGKITYTNVPIANANVQVTPIETAPVTIPTATPIPQAVQPTAIPAVPPVAVDAARIQELKNSIAEGEMIAKSGKKTDGTKMSKGELGAVNRSIENAKIKLNKLESVNAPVATAPVEQVLPIETAIPPVVKIPATTNEAEQKAALDAMKALPVGGMIEMNGAIYKKNDKSGYDIVSATTTPEPVATAPVAPAPVSPNTPLHTVVNNETKMEASVYPRDDGTFNVAQKDLESGETLPTFKNFKTQQEAVDYANTINLPKAPVEAAKPKAKAVIEPLDTSAVSDVIVEKMKKKDGYSIYKRKSDPEYWFVQSPENKAKNIIGSGDTAHSTLGTANDQIFENLNNEQPIQEAEQVKQTPATEKQLKIEANLARQEAQQAKAKQKARSDTLLTKLINLGGVSIKDKRDVTGEKQSFPPGYARAFRTDAKTSLRGHIERGDLDEFLPNNMRLSANTMAQGAFDSEPAYDYLSNLIKNGKSVTPYIEAEKQATEFERYAGTETMLSDSEGDVLDDLVKWATEGGIDIEALKQSLVGDTQAQKERNLLRMLQEARDEEQSNAEPIETTEGPAGPDIKTGIQETAGELKLTGQTEAEIKAGEAKVKAAEETKAKEEAKAEQKRKAEKETFTLTGSDRETDKATAAGVKGLFDKTELEADFERINKNTIRFSSGLTAISDLTSGAETVRGNELNGIGIDIGQLSANGLKVLADKILGGARVFVDSGAFSIFKSNVKNNEDRSLNFDAILEKYNAITQAVEDLNEWQDYSYPRPMFVMPDIVGNQKTSIELVEKYANYIKADADFDILTPIVPIQKGELTLAEVYKKIVSIIGTNNFVVGLPSNAEAISKDELKAFLQEIKPANVHFLGAAANKTLTPLLHIVAEVSPNTKVTADASQIRSKILSNVRKGMNRQQAINAALNDYSDPQWKEVFKDYGIDEFYFDKVEAKIVSGIKSGLDELKAINAAIDMYAPKKLSKQQTITPKNLGAKVTPQVLSNADAEKFIKIAADSVKELRKQDVERVLNETPAHYRSGMASYIKENRKDLIDEVNDIQNEASKDKTEAEIEADEEAAYEALQEQAETEIDEGPIGQALLKIDDGDFETKAQVRSFINKLEKDGILDDVEDAREGLSDREQTAEDVLDTVRGLLDDARDDAVQERVDELESEPKAKTNEFKTIAEPILNKFVEEALAGFLVGDSVRFGNTPGVVVGIEGDYVKFRPDSAKSPKAYQRVQKSQLTLVSRPDNASLSSASKEENKFGIEKGEFRIDREEMFMTMGASKYSATIVDMSVKELLQNAFDAVKGAVLTGAIKEGDIVIDIDHENRSIKITDNAKGMTRDIVQNAFFTVAGSDKTDLPPEERSGGFGIAKVGFMLSCKKIILNTVRDGVRIKVDATPKQIISNNFDIVKTPAPKNEHGTSVEIIVPESYSSDDGSTKDIYFPYSLSSIIPLTKPLVGPAKVTVNFKKYNDTETTVLPIGVNFDKKEMPLLTKAKFSWGTADIYLSANRPRYPKHEVLSSGVYQFERRFALSKQEGIPYDVVINIKPTSKAKSLDYPFEDNRERFKDRISKDIDALEAYLARVARGEEAKELQENFKGIVSMPRVEAGEDLVEVSKKLHKVFNERYTQPNFELAKLPDVVNIADDVVSDMKGNVIVDTNKERETKKESTFKAQDEVASRDKFMIKMEQDPKLPIFHNNTNVDYISIGKPYGDPEQFFAELGTLMVEMKEELGKSNVWGYDILNPENLFFAGVSVDKKYGGVHIKVPYKAVLFNPFYDWGAKTLFGVRQNFLNTMIHEIAHTGDMEHGVGHNGQMIKVEQYLADNGLLDYYRDAILDVLVRHESAFTAMREAYGKSTTQNTAKSLEDYAKGSASARGVEGGGRNKVRTVPTGGRQAGNVNLQADTGFNKQGKLSEPIGKLYNIESKVQTKTPDEVRDERIQELRVASMKVGKAVKHIADYGSNLPLQRKLNKLLEREASLKDYLESTKPENNSDADFMARATKELAAGNISEEVEAVIRQIYEKYPGVLSGLKLSVKQNKHLTSSAAGAFNPYARIVSLYKNTSGVEDESTVRHEIVHSLEQMMTPQAAQAVVDAWARAFEKAMKKNIDPASKAYFDAVLEFLASPSKESFEKATNLMPSYDFYQYLNPSEYWAVNAESMLQAKLGTPWHRFVLGVKRLIEGLKSVLGFDNTYVVHNALNNLLKTTPQRLSKTSLVDYVVRGKVKIDFLNNIDDERRLMDNLGVPNVPSHIPKTLREKIGETHKSTEELVGEIKRGPNNVLKAAGSAVGDAITEARIQAINFNAGLERADAKKYAGKIRDANNNMLPSIAVKNATHANSVYNAVLHQGKMRYDKTLGAFTAYDSDESLKNIVELQHKLRKKTGVELGDKVINSWFAAKRTKGIQDSYLNLMKKINSLQEELLLEDDPEVIAQLTADLNAAQHWLDALEAAFINVPSFLVRVNPAKPTKVVDGKTIPNIIYDRDGMPVLNDDAIDEIIALEDKYPELKEMMKNWKGVSHNMIDNMAFSSRISQKEADGLKEIKDYSPWQRIRDEEEEGLFGNRSTGATSGIARFRKTRTELPLENVIENMTNQVKRMVNSSLTSFAYNRIAMEYAVRKDQVIDKKTGLPKVDKTTGLPAKGKIKVFPKEREGRSSEGVIFPIYVNGNRIHIQIEDSQIADALLGLAMGPVNVPFQAALSGFSNLVRRSITFSGYFQTKQVFYDAPTAAWVSGVKSPFKVWVKSFSTYAKALGSIVTGVDAPTIKILKAAGVGGYHTFHRESLAEEQTTLEAISGKGFARFKRMVDRIGDASDYAQRGAIYDQVLAETGDPSLALLKASDIVDWNKRGLHDAAQGLRQTVPFLGAYAIQLDAFSQAAIAGGTISSAKAGKEVTRRQALMQFYLKTGLGMALLVAAYTLAAGYDDDYWKLDDDTRARNFYVPGSKKAFGNPILIPMHSTAALFWKVIPESMLSYVLSQGTKNEIDASRARSALWRATKDSVLGPMPIPAAIKTPAEIAINYDFFTGTNVVPQSLAKLDASEQYNYNTSELGKALSVATTIPFTGNKDKQGNRQGEKRVLNPIEADHLIRGWLGSVGSISEWVSNQLFGEYRPASELRSNPLVGGIVGPETSRRNEALFYDLKDKTEPAYNTYIKLIKENKASEVKNFYDANRNLIEAYGYTSKMDSKLQELNSYMKFVGKIEDKSWTKDKKLAEILRMQKLKSDILEGTLYFRKRAGL